MPSGIGEVRCVGEGEIAFYKCEEPLKRLVPKIDMKIRRRRGRFSKLSGKAENANGTAENESLFMRRRRWRFERLFRGRFRLLVLRFEIYLLGRDLVVGPRFFTHEMWKKSHGGD